MKIEELEPQLAQRLGDSLRQVLRSLNFSLPESYEVRVALLDANRRKKKSNAAANNWSPESGRLEIRFEPVRAEQSSVEKSGTVTGPPITSTHIANEPASSVEKGDLSGYVHPAEMELLRALDRAESRPGWNFVPLKKFRDEILPQEAPELIPSLRTDVDQRHMLQSVIDKRFVLIGKVSNPKAPQFPVTTIRVNRLIPQVAAIFGQHVNGDLAFRPLEIAGEPLSETILRERR
jgi:hypothetical protein